jgi:hypothetical protein
LSVAKADLDLENLATKIRDPFAAELPAQLVQLEAAVPAGLQDLQAQLECVLHHLVFAHPSARLAGALCVLLAPAVE